MRPRAWLGIVLMSILGHVALLWPGAVRHLPASGVSALNVTLVVPVPRLDPLPGAFSVEEGLQAGTVKGGAGIDGRKMRRAAAGEKVVTPSNSSRAVGSSRDNDVVIQASDPELQQAPAVSAERQSGAAALDAYRFALAREVLRIQSYPAQLQERAQGGIVELEVRLPEAGRSMPLISILASSGRRALDEAALDAMQEGLKSIPLPAAHGSFRLSVLFEAGRVPEGAGGAGR
ncbi:TonB family protein [Zoogloea dura]|uniref:TonB family protein n=1 Tax=Zoogloea dura TaxID=2728840 RepID=A0A848GFC8_9RHOO|nr:TonB family protein [Zoogloea dura]NML29093.1 TonB family protein [Zoogloea dura]